MRRPAANIAVAPPAPRRSPMSRPADSAAVSADVYAHEAAALEDALFEVKRVIVGQDRMVERGMVSLLARGHCLIEGVPGLRSEEHTS